MKKYTYYGYEYDGDGGEAFKRSELFTPIHDFYNMREKIGEFDTAEEYAALNNNIWGEGNISVEEAQRQIDEYEEYLATIEDY